MKQQLGGLEHENHRQIGRRQETRAGIWNVTQAHGVGIRGIEFSAAEPLDGNSAGVREGKSRYRRREDVQRRTRGLYTWSTAGGDAIPVLYDYVYAKPDRVPLNTTRTR
jgi:hypothetical protein